MLPPCGRVMRRIPLVKKSLSQREKDLEEGAAGLESAEGHPCGETSAVKLQLLGDALLRGGKGEACSEGWPISLEETSGPAHRAKYGSHKPASSREFWLEHDCFVS